MIHEIQVPIAVYCRKHGEGIAMFLIDYGYNINTVWVVRLKGGGIKHFLSDDVLVYANPMDGQGFDIDIPKEWEV
jgi:hypothetical protein